MYHFPPIRSGLKPTKGNRERVLLGGFSNSNDAETPYAD